MRGTLTCAACGTANREGRTFCAECGTALTLGCASCGAANEPPDRFCGECGAPLPEADLGEGLGGDGREPEATALREEAAATVAGLRTAPV